MEQVWESFIGRFPTPEAMAAVDVGEVLRAWERLGYPRRARRLWESARIITGAGWPEDLTELPGVGRYTAGAVAAQAFGTDVPAVEVNIRRVTERVAGRALTEREAEAEMARLGRGRGDDVLGPRDRLLALMDVGAMLCRPRDPRCGGCPLRRRCATRGVRPGEQRSRQGPFEGSFRQRRGQVLAALRDSPTPVGELDAQALASLVDDGLAVVDGTLAHLP